MDRDEAIALLPVTYQQALTLLAGGCSDDEIAERLGIDRQSLAPLVELAEAKLARLTNFAPLGERDADDA